MSMNRPPEDTQPAQIRELVSKYCRLDYEGVRLEQQGWSKFEPLVWWKSNPEYTQINVIARYTVDPEPVSNHGKFTVTVHYKLLGTFDAATGYVREPEVSTQDVDFIVSVDNTNWRISNADNTLPHPSRAAVMKWLTGKIRTAQEVASKARYQDALTQLQAQSASPFAK